MTKGKKKNRTLLDFISWISFVTSKTNTETFILSLKRLKSKLEDARDKNKRTCVHVTQNAENGGHIMSIDLVMPVSFLPV